jgi:capsular exopolysaccharide synthesis family protein
LLASSSVVPKNNSDLLVFDVTNKNREDAARLADSYARQFTIFRRELDTATLQSAKTQLQRRIQAAGTAERAQLLALLEEVKLVEALQTSNTFVVHPSETAVQVAPKPVEYAVIGAFLGLLLGVGLAFVLEALDKRVRSEEEIGAQLGMYLLGRIPKQPEHVTRNDGLVMLEEPNGADAEAFRVLRTNLEFVNFDRKAKTIIVTSASRGEGKSHTVANLAVAFARAGRRVALVDLDIRKPTIHTLFKVRKRPGLTDVVLGQASMEAATKVVSGVQLLPAGLVPPNPGEFVSFGEVSNLLDALAKRVDLVLIDTPPMLLVGDALTLTAKVDAAVIVVPAQPERPKLVELRRALATSPATKLGFVLTGTTREESQYGYIPEADSGTRGKSPLRVAPGDPGATEAVEEDTALVSERWQVRGGS